MIKKQLVTIAAIIICVFQIHAQGNTAPGQAQMVQLDEQKDLQEQLIPLEDIVDIAVSNSPSVKFQQDLVDAAEYQLAFSKRLWTNNIVGFVNYSSGNQSLVSSDSQTAGSLSSTNITNGYRTGIQINIPLYEIVGRKARVNLYKAQLHSTINKKQESIGELRKNVIQLYYSLLYYGNLLSIRSDAKQTVMNQYQIAQKQFKDGAIEVSELSRLKSIEVNARADYEEAKREFSISYYQMEALVGVPFQKLIRK